MFCKMDNLLKSNSRHVALGYVEHLVLERIKRNSSSACDQDLNFFTAFHLELKESV